jgi:hypothetical protein
MNDAVIVFVGLITKVAAIGNSPALFLSEDIKSAAGVPTLRRKSSWAL